MRALLKTLAICLLQLLDGSAIARPADLKLSGDAFWTILASRQDQDRAIAVARSYAFLKPFVVRTSNGWFAVLIGPVTAKSGTGRQVLNDMIRDKGVPADAFFTKGAQLIDTVWKAKEPEVLASVDYDGERDANLRYRDLDIRLSREKVGKDENAPLAVARYKGKDAFRATIRDSPSEKPASSVSVLSLDPTSAFPQVVFTYFWQGAHCCTVTKIATLNDGGWLVVDGEALDGSGGYAFERLDSDGAPYLVARDQAFLYAFDSYAGSVAPLRLSKLVGTRLVNVTAEPQFRARMLQSLYGIEDAAAKDADLWKSNGFLAGWVAASIRVDRGQDAWRRMLMSYDHASDFGPQKCATGAKVEACPANKLVRLAFPFALREFLVENGYIRDRAEYPAPFEIEPAKKRAGD